MLRQAVRTFLYQQNKLTYCCLQGTIRRFHSQYLSQTVHCRIRYVERTTVNKRFCRPLHVTCICASIRKKRTPSNLTRSSDTLVTGDAMDNLVTGDRNDVDVKKETITTDLRKKEDNVSNEDFETVHNCQLHLNDIDLQRYNGVDDVENNTESLISELLPLANDNVQMANTSSKTLIPDQGFYQPKSIIQSLLDEDIESTDIATSERSAELDAQEEDYLLKLAEKGELQVEGIEKVELPALTDLAPFVNETEVLRQLVMLGVDLTVIQKTGMIERVITMDFKKDVGPYVFFLKDCGVNDEDMGKVITRCPWIFEHDVHNLKVRIDYLLSKKFKKDGIANMINRDPKFLLVPVEKIDAKLGFLQKEFKLTGDGRMDSPGHSAQYCTYTLIEYESKDILVCEIVNKRETNLKSTIMEKVGLSRALAQLTAADVSVKELVTDASTTISSMIRKEHEDIHHSFDTWHGAKTFGKRLATVAAQSKNKALGPWVQDIINHFWYCSRTADGNENVFTAKWRGVLHHVADVHECAWGDGVIEPKCDHGQLAEHEVCKWLEPGGTAHSALANIVLDNRFLHTLHYYAKFRHTGELETFHEHILMYCSKTFAYTNVLKESKHTLITPFSQRMGNQIREKVSGLSKLVIAKSYIIKESKFYMKQMLGFTDTELKSMFLEFPKIFLKDVGYVTDQFDYLHNVMELPHELIAKNPKALNSSRQRLRSRHRFLVKCGRAQYDPTQPNYVSLQTLTTQEDEIWCLEVAKASVAEYNQFLRLI